MARERRNNFVLGVVPLFAVPPFSYENQSIILENVTEVKMTKI